ncbi:acyltransferase [Adlercreutzia muris]|jgi:surface polysaccharide O-acyltransferase-like enzyme|uniref:acyltransferase n=1 Tax=Adlercreutzia muris TaxID=1796610 RepID=UPI0013667B0B|nr:acyltransferase [Adlercreutzia muris]MCI8305582.1 acyltransferase [Enterorhabdus sp.]NCA31472.1 acyltransferase [Adlercreutzia muris]
MRSSNIELLRIVSMVLIVMFHFSVHGSWPAEGPLASDIAVECLSFGGKLGVNCFVLITGYFMVSGRLRLASLLRVVLETWFYSFALLGIFLIADPTLVTEEKLRRALTPIASGEYWFVTCYLALMVASPSLNVLYRHLSPAGRSRLAAAGFVAISLLPTLTTFNPIGNDLVWFFYLYLIGGWLREQRDGARPQCVLDPTRIVGHWGAERTFAGCVLVVWASMAAIGWARRELGFDFVGPDYLIWQYMVPTFFAAIGLFRIFAAWEMPCSPWVNMLAKTALGVYLIHDNPIVRAWLWPHLAWVYPLGPAAIIAFGLGSALAVFALGSLIDYGRIALLERPFFRWLERSWGPQMQKAGAWLADIGQPGARPS